MKAPARLAAALALSAALTAAAALGAGPVVAAGACPNEAFRTGPSAALPECRAYEQVTSAKNDADAMTPPNVTPFHSGAGSGQFGLPAVSGGGLLWTDNGSSPYAEPSNGIADVFQSTRTTAGWSPAETLAPAAADGSTRFLPVNASADLSAVLMLAISWDPVTGKFLPDASLVEREGDGSFATIATLPMEAGELIAAHFNPDGSHTFFESQARLLPGDMHGPIDSRNGLPLSHEVYEWTRGGGLRLAGVDSAGAQVSPCGAALAGTGGRQDVSTDGSRLFFQSPDPASTVDVPGECRLGPLEVAAGGVITSTQLYVSDLYLREGDSTTTNISKPPPGVPDYGAEFIGATPDGSEVFFVTATALTPDKASSGPGHGDLYRYDVETGALTRLSVGPPGYDDARISANSALTHASAYSALASADGSHVYFTAQGQLVPGKGASPATNQSDRTSNLYLWASGRVSFIATIGLTSLKRGTSFILPPLRPLFAAVTPDGSDLVFNSVSQLTAYDNQGAGELYRYDAPTSAISCVSCSPTGSPPNSPWRPDFHSSFEGFQDTYALESGGLSADGSTVFFASADRLLPAAVNAAEPSLVNPIYNVYEWHGGQLSLISSGTSSSSDFLVGASASGEDVFFLSGEQLAPSDGDHAYDIYDARVGGGFPASAEPVSCDPLAGACQGPPTPTPATGAVPASQSFSGPGNPKPNRPCAKGKHRVKGRCIKKHHERGRHHSRASHRATNQNRRAAR